MVDNRYEMVFLIDPTLEEDAVMQVTNRIHQAIEAQGGEFRRDDRWGRRRLAYEINRHREAIYHLLSWDGPHALVASLTRFLHTEPGVLRFLITRVTQAQQLDEERLQKLKEAQMAKAAAAEVAPQPVLTEAEFEAAGEPEALAPEELGPEEAAE